MCVAPVDYGDSECVWLPDNQYGPYSVREPDFVVGELPRRYLRRWHIIPRNAWFNLYLHEIKRGDDDRALHDHYYINLSLILDGGYVEVLPDGRGYLIRKWRAPGSVVFRRARSRHRLELPPPEHPPGPVTISPHTCWSLFITGPRTREWGFYCNSGWKHFADFVNPEDGGATVGRGCDAPSSVPGTAKRDTAA